MDENSKELIREIRDAQAPELELLDTNVFPAWTGFQFSLRALLITTTLAAVILGAIGVLLSQAKKDVPPAAPARPFHEVRPF
jgi:hypothetical protein